MQNNPLATLPVKHLQAAVAIREQIESLEKELSRIIVGRSFPKTAASAKESRFSAARTAKIPATAKTRRAKVKEPKPVASKSKQASARGQLKERIIGALMEAGKPGVTIKDMSEKLGTSYGNISVWFHTTAKGVKEVKKVAPGRFAWMS